MAEKGILFNGDMMRAIRADLKGATRRPLKAQPNEPWARPPVWVDGDGHYWSGESRSDLKSPYAVGDLLYCRETFATCKLRQDVTDEYHSYVVGNVRSLVDTKEAHLVYRADQEPDDEPIEGRWTPSIHMPKWAAREWLKVTAVRAERLQEISEEDVKAEGFEISGKDGDSRGYEWPQIFRAVWNMVYPKVGQSWQDNPWVWVTEFERTEN